jgi:hypothetical protein
MEIRRHVPGLGVVTIGDLHAGQFGVSQDCAAFIKLIRVNVCSMPLRHVLHRGLGEFSPGASGVSSPQTWRRRRCRHFFAVAMQAQSGRHDQRNRHVARHIARDLVQYDLAQAEIEKLLTEVKAARPPHW